MSAPAPRRRVLSRRLRWLLSALVVVLLLGVPTLVLAHPLGNFSVNRYSRLELGAEAIELFYVVDMAEIPTFQAMPEIDVDGNGEVSGAENQAYLATQLATLQSNLHLTVNGEAVPLNLREQGLEFPEGQGGLQTTRLTARFEATLPRAGVWETQYRDDNYADRLGWKEIVVQPQSGASLLDSSVSSEDVTQALTEYPQDLLQNPLNVTQATFSFEPGVGAAETSTAEAASVAVPGAATDPFADLISARPVGGAALLLILAGAFGWGAAHALSPGHGKTIVAAYLVGSRGTAKHALFLGLTTTITHTAGVFALGFVTLFLSRYILPEQLYPWLGVLSGLLVVSIGASLLQQRLRTLRDPHASHGHDHSHEGLHEHGEGLVHSHGGLTHSHAPPGADGGPVTWKNLLALGVSGGLLPCPSALVVLLSAIALQRVGFGLLLILIFSLGLASVLTAIGILMVHAGRLFKRIPTSGRLFQVVPAASALLITLAGVGITLQAFTQTGVLKGIAVAFAGPF